MMGSVKNFSTDNELRHKSSKSQQPQHISIATKTLGRKRERKKGEQEFQQGRNERRKKGREGRKITIIMVGS